MKCYRWLLVVFMFIGFSGGCNAFSDPTTLIQAGPFGSAWMFKDNKDNDISIEEASYNSKTGDSIIKGVVIRNNSSDPREANVKQMDATTRQIEAMSGLIEKLVAQIVNLVSAPPGVGNVSTVDRSPVPVPNSVEVP